MTYAIKSFKGSGCASRFYKMKNSKRGFKEFDNYEAARIAHYNQTKLAEHDLAPRVYSEVGKIRKRNDNGLTHWGYITEVAITIGCAGNSCNCCDREELECEYESEIDDLVSDIEDVGFYFGDCHIGNVGYIKRNGKLKMVCLDTGDESVSSDDGPCFCLECKNGGCCRD